jgi:hypothetical protein
MFVWLATVYGLVRLALGHTDPLTVVASTLGSALLVVGSTGQWLRRRFAKRELDRR